MPVIELKAPRVIVIEDRGKQYTLTVGRIQKKQWLRYFDGIVSTSENQNGKRIDSFDSSAARLVLVEDTLLQAAPYVLPGEINSLDKVEGWKSMLPLSHRMGVANALIAVGPSELPDTDTLKLGVESIYLDAVWGADEDGKMRKFRGLRHYFQTPTAEHQRRFSRDNSRSRVVGGSRAGKTQWLGAQATLADLYDELIMSVDGYAIDGKPLTSIDIVEYMDTYHKVVAADLLFAPMAPRIDEGND